MFVLSLKDLDGNDLLSYWPALEEGEANAMQKWGSERPLGGDCGKDAANNNPTDAVLTSGDESNLTQPHKHRKGERSVPKQRHVSSSGFFLILISLRLSLFLSGHRYPEESSGLPSSTPGSFF